MKQVFVLTNTETDTVVGVFYGEQEAYLYTDYTDPGGTLIVIEQVRIYETTEDATKGIDTPA